MGKILVYSKDYALVGFTDVFGFSGSFCELGSILPVAQPAGNIVYDARELAPWEYPI